MLALTPITGSSQLAAYGYDPAARVLTLRFARSKFDYQYADVEQEAVDAFMAAESKGKFFSERIKTRFDCTRIDTGNDDAVAEPTLTAQAGFSHLGQLVCLLVASLLLAVAVRADNTITQGSTTLFRGTTNLGAYPSVAACLEGARTRTISATTSYQCRLALAAAPIVAPPPPVPVVTFGANPSTVQPGQASALSWSSTGATGCTAGGSWNGTKATGGSEATALLTATSTFSLSCSGSGGTGNASTTVTVAAAGTQTGLDFPSNSFDYTDIRFRFTGAALLPMQPATYIWNVKPRQQTGFYTTFFHGPDGAFTGGGDYYGAHPYPNAGSSSDTHKWEISTWGYDYVNDVNGNSTAVQYGRWHTQALVVANNVLTFYYDLPDTNRRIVVNHPGLSPRSNQALTFGDAPWNQHGERLSGVLRGIRLYSASLSLADVLAEANAPLSTSAGTAAVWYLNMNPTPSDISDKSGRGNNPAWVSGARPVLWSE